VDAHAVHDLAHGTDLSRSAIDQQKVGPHAILPVRVFLLQPLETTQQHLFHHAGIVTRRQFIAPDVELAVLVLVEPVWANDDHRADSMAPLDVRVVVDLNPLGRLVHVESLGHAAQQLGLGRCLAHLAGKAFAGVAQGPLNQFGLFAALGHQDLDLAFGLFSQCLQHQVFVVQSV